MKDSTSKAIIFGGLAAFVVASIALVSTSAKLAGGFIVVRPPGRLVKMQGGSSVENMAKLIEAFGPFVIDQGDGVYSVSVATEQSATVPGARVL